MPRRFPAIACVLALLGLLPPAPPAARASAAVDSRLAQIEHLVVIYQENRSFDHVFGTLPNVNGVADADAAHTTQVDPAGNPYRCLPQTDPDLTSPPLPSDACNAADDGFNSHFPNRPFLLDSYIAPDATTIDPVHRFYQHQVQVNGGRNDRFVAVSNARGLVMGYHESTTLPFAAEAATFTIGDNFFQAAFGGSFLNHQWLICACTPQHTGTTSGLHTVLGANGVPTIDGPLTPAPETYAVNTMQPSNTPNGPGARLPLLENPTIGDRLTEAGISWAWYSGGWDSANQGSPGSFTFNHQPFNYYANYGPGKPGRAHLKDETEFLTAAGNGTLPAVSFVKPIGIDNEHPGTSLVQGQQHTLDLVEAVRNGPDWKDTMIVVTYDENGGYWDHVPPPAGDRWGPGTRIPMAVVSPFARRNFVDHTVYDTTSILATIERRWGVAPLGTRDAAANDLRTTLVTPESPEPPGPGPGGSGARYRLVAADGGVFAFGDASFHGSAGSLQLASPIVGMGASPTGQGYWLVASDGGVFAFGDAGFHGSAGATKLAQPVVGISPTPTGRGYRLVAADGGVFSFGDATFEGSTGNTRLARPIVGSATTPTGRGYWLVASDGGVFAFGDAGFHGSAGATKLAQPVVGISPTPTGRGYRLVAADGGVFSFGDATFEGSTGNTRLARPIVGSATTPTGRGYWLVASDGGVFAFGDAGFHGSAGATKLAQPVVGISP